MQLNNNITGQIIKIDKIKDIGVYYKLFPNKHCLDFEKDFEIKKAPKIADNFEPSILRSWGEMHEEAGLKEVLKIETNYVYSEEDTQNWVVSDRPVRMTLSVEFSNEVQLNSEHSALATILNRELEANRQATEKFIFQNNNSVTSYFFEVSGEDYPIVAPYIYNADTNPNGQIFIEQKEV